MIRYLKTPRHRPIHTNGIEGTWKWARLTIPVCGIKGGDHKYYLRFAELCYKRLLRYHPKWKGSDSVKLLLKHIANWYNAGQPQAIDRM